MSEDSDFTTLPIVAETWVQTLRGEGGTFFRMKGFIGHTTDLVISGGQAAKGLPIEIGFYRGIQDWEIPDVPKDALGFIGYSRRINIAITRS